MRMQDGRITRERHPPSDARVFMHNGRTWGPLVVAYGPPFAYNPITFALFIPLVLCACVGPSTGSGHRQINLEIRGSELGLGHTGGCLLYLPCRLKFHQKAMGVGGKLRIGICALLQHIIDCIDVGDGAFQLVACRYYWLRLRGTWAHLEQKLTRAVRAGRECAPGLLTAAPLYSPTKTKGSRLGFLSNQASTCLSISALLFPYLTLEVRGARCNQIGISHRLEVLSKQIATHLGQGHTRDSSSR